MQTPPVIVHVAAPAGYGGLERLLEGLLSGLAQRGTRVHLVAILDCGATPPPWLATLAQRGVTLHTLISGGRRYRREWLALRELLRRIRPQIVHTHGYRADVIAGLAGRAEAVPVVTTMHGFTRYGIRNRLYEWLQVRSAAKADAAIAVSQPLAAELARRGVPQARIALIPNRLLAGGDPPLSRAIARQRLGIRDTGFLVGWVGRLSHEKNPQLFVDAIALAAPELHACVIGSGPDEAALHAQAKLLGMADKIHFAGAIPGAGALLPAFDALALSSRTEGTPMVILEAAAAKVPVISTEVGGIPDLVGPDGALLVPDGDAHALAKAIMTIQRDNRGAAHRAQVLHDRVGPETARQWIDDHVRLYERVDAVRSGPHQRNSAR